MSSIDILPSDDQLEIVEGIARALASQGLGKTDISTIAELGYLGAGLSEADGGFGLSVADEALIHIKLGRHVADIRILATMLAARLAAANGETALCKALIIGREKIGFAVPVQGWPRSSTGPSGDAYFVGDGDLYLALSPHGGCLVPASDVATHEQVESMDASASASRATITAVKPWSVGGKEGIWQVAMLFAAAQLTGTGQAALHMGAEYAKTREQFDKPIGTFQGIAHPLADCALRSEAATNQVYYAAIALRDGFPDATQQVTAALLVGIDAGLRNATTNIQTHGAMGYSAETGAHLYLKRAVVLRQIVGGIRMHERAMLADTG
ncbi:hypothetical protein C1T17_02490 [Sphingobium sp. SCG-1]|uniref:acyl-CoA dehydrogenase n=1 Tax=Sphingobium sp. SCG-1 TaxID=2072936 RepID=UPI000CD6B612|nr:acyl-CoA dehydrogenase [Sphingobium sp. SCG-1]AUW57119.1 hypothetical protein C1T17_02490 [Sphingobium sp. SCG-1]